MVPEVPELVVERDPRVVTSSEHPTGTFDLTVETADGLRSFSLDRRESSRSPQLAELHPGDDVDLLVERVPSGQDRLWELRRGGTTIVDYAVTRAYVEAVYGDQDRWFRIAAAAMAMAAFAAAWLPRASRSPLRARGPRWLHEDEEPQQVEPVFVRSEPFVETEAPDPGIDPPDPGEPLDFGEPPDPGDAPLPPVLADVAATHPVPVLLALMLDEPSERRVTQLESIGEAFDADLLESLKAIAPAVGRLSPKRLLELADLALPALPEQPAALLGPFTACIDAMIPGDGLPGVYRYCLGRIIHFRLAAAGAPEGGAAPQSTPSQARAAITLLLATLARYGHDRVETAERAFATGMGRILPGEKAVYAPMAGNIGGLDRVWEPLRALEPDARRRLVDAIVATIGSDGKTTLAESQLLHAVCALLDCPLPSVEGSPGSADERMRAIADVLPVTENSRES